MKHETWRKHHFPRLKAKTQWKRIGIWYHQKILTTLPDITHPSDHIPSTIMSNASWMDCHKLSWYFKTGRNNRMCLIPYRCLYKHPQWKRCSRLGDVWLIIHAPLKKNVAMATSLGQPMGDREEERCGEEARSSKMDSHVTHVTQFIYPKC